MTTGNSSITTKESPSDLSSSQGFLSGSETTQKLETRKVDDKVIQTALYIFSENQLEMLKSSQDTSALLSPESGTFTVHSGDLDTCSTPKNNDEEVIRHNSPLDCIDQQVPVEKLRFITDFSEVPDVESDGEDFDGDDQLQNYTTDSTVYEIAAKQYTFASSLFSKKPSFWEMLFNKLWEVVRDEKKVPLEEQPCFYSFLVFSILKKVDERIKKICAEKRITCQECIDMLVDGIETNRQAVLTIDSMYQDACDSHAKCTKGNKLFISNLTRLESHLCAAEKACIKLQMDKKGTKRYDIVSESIQSAEQFFDLIQRNSQLPGPQRAKLKERLKKCKGCVGRARSETLVKIFTDVKTLKENGVVGETTTKVEMKKLLGSFRIVSSNRYATQNFKEDYLKEWLYLDELDRKSEDE